MEWRDLSPIHSSLIASFTRGSTRSTSDERLSMRIAEPSASSASTLSVLRSSQGRATKAYGFAVSAPTGQMSTRLPDSSEVSARST